MTSQEMELAAVEWALGLDGRGKEYADRLAAVKEAIEAATGFPWEPPVVNPPGSFVDESLPHA